MAKKKKAVLGGKMAEIAEREPRFSILSDGPLSDEGINYEDFNLNYHLGPVFDILRDPDTKPPMAIAIYGGWGTGKTTGMKWLEAMLEHWNEHGEVGDAKRRKVEVKPVWFCPWKYDNKEDVWRGLIGEVILGSIRVQDGNIGTITKAAKQFGLFLGRSFLHALSALSVDVGVVKAEGKDVAAAMRGIVDEFNKVSQPEKGYLNEFETALAEWVDVNVQGDRRLVVFVDDLDRCMPEVALQVLEALKLYLNIEKLIFVVGVDKEIIDKLVAYHYSKQGFDPEKPEDRRKFETYLEKIFQVEVHLGPTQPQMGDYLDTCLKSVPAWSEYLRRQHQKIFRELIRLYGGRTPRKIKRRINSSLREGVGATKVVTDGDSKLACAQGMQLHFIREELRLLYKRLLGMLGDGGSGDGFFRDWSRVVIENVKKDKGFPVTVNLREAEKGAEPGAKVPPAYEAILGNPAYKDYLGLLGNRHLGMLMQIPYPPTDSPLLSSARAVSERAEAETSDDQRILEAIARHAGKPAGGLTASDLDQIEHLGLGGMGLAEFGILGRLKGLRRLNLADNGLSGVPAEVLELKNLTTLYLSDNRIADAKPLEGLTNLTELDLSGNQLRDVESVAALRSMVELDLSGNRLKDARALTGLANLTELNLSANELTDAKPLAELKSLRELDLSANEIADTGALAGLENLRSLDLSGNPIENLGPLAGLKKKAYILSEAQQEIYEGKRGKAAIKKIFKDGYDYSETVEGVELFKCVRPDVAARNSKSFQRLACVLKGRCGRFRGAEKTGVE